MTQNHEEHLRSKHEMNTSTPTQSLTRLESTPHSASYNHCFHRQPLLTFDNQWEICGIPQDSTLTLHRDMAFLSPFTEHNHTSDLVHIHHSLNPTINPLKPPLKLLNPLFILATFLLPSDTLQNIFLTQKHFKTFRSISTYMTLLSIWSVVVRLRLYYHLQILFDLRLCLLRWEWKGFGSWNGCGEWSGENGWVRLGVCDRFLSEPIQSTPSTTPTLPTTPFPLPFRHTKPPIKKMLKMIINSQRNNNSSN